MTCNGPSNSTRSADRLANFHDHSNVRPNEDRLSQGVSEIFWLLGKLAQAQPCPEEYVQRNQSSNDGEHAQLNNP